MKLNEWFALRTDTVLIHLKRVWISEEPIISQKMVHQTCNLSVLSSGVGVMVPHGFAHGLSTLNNPVERMEFDSLAPLNIMKPPINGGFCVYGRMAE